MSDTTPNVHERMAAVVADLDYIPKGRSRGVSYEFRSIDALMNKLHGPLAEHGLYLSPQVLDDWQLNAIPGSPDRNGNERTQFQALFRVQVTVHAADGSSVVLGPGLAQSHDYGDKAVYQAQQNAIKYLLLEAFCIPVDEPDMDGRQADESPRSAAPQAERSGPAAGDTRKPTNPQKAKARMLLIEHGIIHTDDDGVVDDTVYRAAFQKMYGEGVDSTTKLTRSQISALIDSLEKGAKGKPPAEIAAAIIERGVAWIIDEGGEPPKWAVES